LEKGHLIVIRKISLLIAATSLLITAPAFAQTPAAVETAPAHGFGSSGSVALVVSHDFLTSEFDLFLGGSGAEVAYFVLPGFSVGVAASAFYATSYAPLGATTGTNGATAGLFRLGPRLGYDLAFGEWASLWLQAGVDFGYLTVSESSNGGGANSSSSNATLISFAATAPILFHPTRGFFIGLGPRFSADIVSNQSSNGGMSQDVPKTVSLGLMALIGGSF
jgi:hypothetical protein